MRDVVIKLLSIQVRKEEEEKEEKDGDAEDEREPLRLGLRRRQLALRVGQPGELLSARLLHLLELRVVLLRLRRVLCRRRVQPHESAERVVGVGAAPGPRGPRDGWRWRVGPHAGPQRLRAPEAAPKGVWEDQKRPGVQVAPDSNFVNAAATNPAVRSIL